MDTMSYIDLTKVIKSIGYKAFKCLWYRHPRKALCKGLKPLNYDFNTLQLAEHVTGFDVVLVSCYFCLVWCFVLVQIP